MGAPKKSPTKLFILPVLEFGNWLLREQNQGMTMAHLSGLGLYTTRHRWSRSPDLC